MTNIHSILAAIVAVFALGLYGCDGDSEQACECIGEQVDESVDEMKDAFDEEGPAEKTGERIDRATGNE